MARNLHPIIIRSGISRLWKNNVTSKHYTNYFLSNLSIYYKLTRALQIFHMALADLKIIKVKWLGKLIIYGIIFRLRIPGFSTQSRIKSFFRKFKLLQRVNYNIQRKLFRILQIWIRSRWHLFLTSDFQNYLSSTIFYNTYGFLMDPLEESVIIANKKKHYKMRKFYKTKYTSFDLVKRSKSVAGFFKAQDKFAENLSRVVLFCSYYMQKIDLTRLFLRIIIMEMEKDKRHWPLIRAVKRILIRSLAPQQRPFNALRIEFRGKLRGARRSRLIRYDITKKRIPYQTFHTKLHSASGFINTVYGTIGVHIWIWFSDAT